MKKSFILGLFVLLSTLYGCATVSYDIPNAAANGDLSSLKWYVNNGYNLNATGGICNQTGLHYASAIGNVEMMTVLLNAGADMNIREGQGFTPLMLALYNKQNEAARLLLQRGARVDGGVINWNKFTTLHYAATYADADIVQLVVNGGVDINAKESRGLTAADLAAKYDRFDVLAILKKAGAEIAYSGDINKDIFLAIYSGDVETVKSLLNQGVNPNIRDKKNNTLLLIAVENNWPDVVELLLQKGADPAFKDQDGWTAQMHAAKDGKEKILQVFESAGIKIPYTKNKKNDLLVAVLTNDLAKAEELLNQKTDPNARYRKNSTLLNYAVFKNGEQMTSLLLSKRANPNLFNNYDTYPLMLAISGNYLEIAKILVTGGANVNFKNNQGVAPLHAAASYGSLEMVQYLVEQGADPDQENSGKVIPLMIAFDKKRFDVVEYLLPKTKKIDSRDVAGYSLLMYAIIAGEPRFVQQLLDKGVVPEYYAVLLSEGKNQYYKEKVNHPEITALIKPQALRRQLLRAEAAVESAQSVADYQKAVAEYQVAMDMAPEMPDIYYNIGAIQDKAGLYNDAIKNLKKYLELTPDSPDAQMVKDLIYKIEYKRDSGK